MAEKEKVKLYNVKFTNLERKGEGHMWSSNGEIFQIEPGKVTQLPLHAINALKDAVKIEWKMKDMHKDRIPEKYEDPRFHIEVLSEVDAKNGMTEKEKAQESIIEEITKVQQGE